MIRVSKSSKPPRSLSETNAYDGKDVLQQLESDQYKKCYLCERRLCADFQVEHHKSKNRNPHLRQNWDNLFWACGYCNNKKGDLFDNTLHPTTVNIEAEIKQSIDFPNKRAEFTATATTASHEETITLLSRIHNGTKNVRTKREENFFEYIISVVNDFQRLVVDYLADPSDEKRSLIQKELEIDKECLGFKYWIIMSNSQLSATFKKDIVWNKH